MLKLCHITKHYGGLEQTPALDDISIEFRKSEFVSILGQSGCGKTTLLNIIGGLDKYSSGDLIIKGVSTKDYNDKDWDAYRNRSIGFVFQSYNLIQHLTVLENVSLALALSGNSRQQQKQRAFDVLERVGLKGQEHKLPNQLSGGQMQRVAIARALVNNPEILLADEPTGALDTKTSLQIMELLKEISAERLVIMVTHNPQLAQDYSTRIIRLLDGKVLEDDNAYSESKELSKKANKGQIEGDVIQKNDTLNEVQQAENLEENKLPKEETANLSNKEKAKKTKTAMSFWTALSISFKNLFSKKARTILTAFAGSIGIIGVCLVLAFSNGFNLYIEKLQKDTLSVYPITITEDSIDYASLMSMTNTANLQEYPELQKVLVDKLYQKMLDARIPNNITENYIENAIKTIPSEYLNYIQYDTGIALNVFCNQGADTPYSQLKFNSFSNEFFDSSVWQKMMENDTFINSQYDILSGHLPTNSDELVLVIDKYNQVSDITLLQLGLINSVEMASTVELNFDRIFAKEYKVLNNNQYYSYNSEELIFETNKASTIDFSTAKTLKIVGIIRPNENTQSAIYSSGIYFTQALENEIMLQNATSDIVQWMNSNTTKNPLTNEIYTDNASATAIKQRTDFLRELGAIELPNSIKIFAINFEAKTYIKQLLDDYNAQQTIDGNKVKYSDMMEMLAGTLSTLVDAISYVLIAFTAISLLVSCIMIGIITYVSVIERTKEIGILRSIGARKKDISSVFNAETFIIGLSAGLIGVVITYLLTIPANAIINSLVSNMNNIAQLNPITALILIGVSVLLTVISGLIPARLASKKDPVIALRTE